MIKCALETHLNTAVGMFNYVSLGTNDLKRAALFYDAVLEPLGLRRCDTWSGAQLGGLDRLGPL